MSELVDKQAVLAAIRSMSSIGFTDTDTLLDAVEGIPTVEERKKGKWMGKPIAGYCTVRCSVCKNVFSENNGKWNFCPTCGADMREEKE